MSGVKRYLEEIKEQEIDEYRELKNEFRKLDKIFERKISKK